MDKKPPTMDARRVSKARRNEEFARIIDGLPRAEVAKRLGLTPRTLQYYLHGRQVPYTVYFAARFL